MGDKNRITHEFSDGTLEKIMKDIDHKKIKKDDNWFMNHPAYYGTSIQQKDRKTNICRGCVYFRAPAAGLKRACQFPWRHPKDHDKVNMEFIPCKGKRRS